MESRIMNVFYGEDCLPYKDKNRSVHYPVIGNTFAGANNTTQIRFYVRDIGGVENVKWVAVSKLPNGQVGNEVLGNDKIHYDDFNQEYYVALDLNSFYTSLKGDVAIALNGYEGGINVEEDSESGIYTIYGTPTIQATGVVIITINYAPQVLPMSSFNFTNLQLILAELAKKLDKINGFYVINNISTADLSSFSEGQYFYDIESEKYYLWNGETYSETNITATSDMATKTWVVQQGYVSSSALGDQVTYSFSSGTLTITSK